MKDDNVYVKKDNGRYEAIGYQFDRDWLSDGIWCVSHTAGSTSMRNISYYGGIYKMGDAKYPDFSKLAGVLEVAELVAHSDVVHEMLNKEHNLYDACATIIGEAFRMSEELNEKSRNHPLIELKPSNFTTNGFTKDGDGWRKKIDGTWYQVYVYPDAYENPRYSKVEVYSTWNNEKVAEFRAEYLHQIYQFVKSL